SGKEFEKMPDGKPKEKLLYIYYSNLAGSYKDLDKLDSARHYASLSRSKDKNHNITEVVNNNLLILGRIDMIQGNYEKALFYFKETEKLRGYKNHINADSLYRDIIWLYTKLNEKDSVKKYQIKRDSLKLHITESKN